MRKGEVKEEEAMVQSKKTERKRRGGRRWGVRGDGGSTRDQAEDFFCRCRVRG